MTDAEARAAFVEMCDLARLRTMALEDLVVRLPPVCRTPSMIQRLVACGKAEEIAQMALEAFDARAQKAAEVRTDE